jgi:hypothetical protein
MAELAAPEIRRLIRAEARARWAIKALEAKLKPARPTDEELRTIAKLAGAGHSDAIYDEQGRPIGLYTVMEGRETLDAKALLATVAALMKTTEDKIRDGFTKRGEPFLSYKEG